MWNLINLRRLSHITHHFLWKNWYIFTSRSLSWIDRIRNFTGETWEVCGTFAAYFKCLTLIIFEIYGTRISGISKSACKIVWLNRTHDRYASSLALKFQEVRNYNGLLLVNDRQTPSTPLLPQRWSNWVFGPKSSAMFWNELKIHFSNFRGFQFLIYGHSIFTIWLEILFFSSKRFAMFWKGFF